MVMFSFPGNADYTAVSQTILFPASARSFTVPVPITNDDVYELDESFTATISEVVDSPSVDITRESTTVTIMNDDSKSRQARCMH